MSYFRVDVVLALVGTVFVLPLYSYNVSIMNTQWLRAPPTSWWATTGLHLSTLAPATPQRAPDPLLADGWEAFYRSVLALPCAKFPECHGRKQCCRAHRIIYCKMVAFSDYMRHIGFPFWTTHAGTLIAMTREGGRIIPNDVDMDVILLGSFNGLDNVVFKNSTMRLLDFNGRYPPYQLMAGMHTNSTLNGGRGPFTVTPWGKGDPHTYVHKTGDYIIWNSAAEHIDLGHADVHVAEAWGNSPHDGCFYHHYSANWVAPGAYGSALWSGPGSFGGGKPEEFTWGVPCPFGLRIGEDKVFHGVQCPGSEVRMLRNRYGPQWQTPLTKKKGGTQGHNRKRCVCTGKKGYLEYHRNGGGVKQPLKEYVEAGHLAVCAAPGDREWRDEDGLQARYDEGTRVEAELP